MNKEENNFDTFIRTGILYKCFIPIDIVENIEYEPEYDVDIFAVSETEALGLLINEDDYNTKFPPNSLAEIPKLLQKTIEAIDRKRLSIQDKLRNGGIDEVRKIKLAFVEIVISDRDIKSMKCEIKETQSNNKYFRVSLKSKKFGICRYVKHIEKIEREIDADTGKVIIKNLVLEYS